MISDADQRALRSQLQGALIDQAEVSGPPGLEPAVRAAVSNREAAYRLAEIMVAQIERSGWTVGSPYEYRLSAPGLDRSFSGPGALEEAIEAATHARALFDPRDVRLDAVVRVRAENHWT